MYTRHNGQKIMITMEQHQNGGSFLRLAWDLVISALDNSVVDSYERANFFFHGIGSLVEQFF
jgi:hypothetical protein